MELMRFAAVACAAAAIGALSAAVPLVPGYDVEPEKRKPKVVEGYVTPAHLRYPYLSTYYIRPTVAEGEAVKIGWYVTDWRHSLVRYNDASARFDVELVYSSDNANWKTVRKDDVPSGDGEFDLGKLPTGDYTMGVRCFDRRSGLPSFTVWQEFRVVGREFLEPPASKRYAMTRADLEAYGLSQDPGCERRVEVEIEDSAKYPDTVNKANMAKASRICREGIDAYLARNPHRDGKIPGYTVYVATWKGVEPVRAFERLKVVYDAGYDTNAVEQAAVRTTDGLQRFLDEKAAAGFREVKLLPGVYRLTASKTLRMPSNLTVDLNGATLKLNPFTGCRGNLIAFSGAKDARLVNGTVEGDYYAHDYAHSPHNTEWPILVTIKGDSRYCALENVTLRDSAAYGAGNGIGDEGPHGDSFTFAKENGKFRNSFAFGSRVDYTPGGLDWRTGALDGKDAFRWTTKPIGVEGLKPFKYLQLSKFLGWQGMRTRNWNYTVCFYDAAGKFVSGEVAMQFRLVRIPPDVATARFSVEVGSKEEADGCELTMYRFKIPWNCTVRKCRFVHCRVVGYAASAMRNFLFEGNEFTRSGEAITFCAFDAEDGADLMQDAHFVRNDFHDNPNNEFLTCAGHNFVLTGNRMNIHLHARTYSPCVRDNVCATASFGCANRNRTGYGRYENNDVREALSVGTGSQALGSDWFIAVRDRTFRGDAAHPFKVGGGATGVFLNCAFEGVQASPGSAIGCTLRDCKTIWSRGDSGRWQDCTAENCVFVRRDATNVYSRCTFRNVNFSCVQFGTQTFDGCTLENVRFPRSHRNHEFGGTVRANCTLKGDNVFSEEMTVEAKP